MPDFGGSGFESATESRSHVQDFAALECQQAQFALNPRDLDLQVAMVIVGKQPSKLRHVLIELGDLALQFFEEVRRLGVVGFLRCCSSATLLGGDDPHAFRR